MFRFIRGYRHIDVKGILQERNWCIFDSGSIWLLYAHCCSNCEWDVSLEVVIKDYDIFSICILTDISVGDKLIA